MAQPNILDIFEECINRIATGDSIDECLQLYPDYAAQLRPMLESAAFMSALRLPDAELRTEQVLVWQQIQRALPAYDARPVARRRPPTLLLVALLLLPALTIAAIFAFTRTNLPPTREPIIVPSQVATTAAPVATTSPSATQNPSATWTETAQPSPTQPPTLTNTLQPSATFTQTMPPTSTERTPTIIRTPAPTRIIRPTATSQPPTATLVPAIPSATFVPGCGAPLTSEDAIGRVLAIYPNTSITEVRLTDDFGDRAVWEVRTSHGIEVNIDVACGTILSIERRGSSTNTPDNSGGSNSGSGSGNSGSSGSGNSGSGSDDDSSDGSDDDHGSDNDDD